jgi:hypothetical protein
MIQVRLMLGPGQMHRALTRGTEAPPIVNFDTRAELDCKGLHVQHAALGRLSLVRLYPRTGTGNEA